MTITIYNSVFSFTKFSHSCHPSNLICCTKKLFQMFKKSYLKKEISFTWKTVSRMIFLGFIHLIN